MYRRYANVFIKFLISSILIYYLIEKIGFQKFLNVFKSIDLLWIGAGIAAFSASALLGSVQWFFLLRNLDIDVKLKNVISYYYTGLFFNNFLLSFVGGDIFRIYDATRASGKNSESISTVFLDRLIGFTALSTLALASVLFSQEIFSSKKVVILIIGFFVVFLILLLFFYFKKFAKKFETLGQKILPERIAWKLREIYRGINFFRNRKKFILQLFFLSLGIQVLRISVHYFTARSLQLDINFLYFLIFIPVISILILLPSIGGIGIREHSAAILFNSIGIVPVKSSSIVFLAFVIGIIASLPGGLLFIFRTHKK